MSDWIIPILVFAVVALFTAVLMRVLNADELRLHRRLRTIQRDGEAGPSAAEQLGTADHLPQVTALLERAGRYGALEGQLRRAGLHWRPSEFAAASVGLMVALALIGWWVYGVIGAGLGLAVGAALPLALLAVLEAQRLARFEAQLPDALMLIATSLRSGYGILRALQAVKEEMPPPISIEFAEVLDESRVGLPVGDALGRLMQRVPLADLEIAVTAILIQLEVGGNLSELMETVAGTVRERSRIRAEMNTLTAEARLSGLILFLIPLAIAVALVMLNPAYMSALFKTTLGHLLIGCAAALQIVGGLVIRRMLRFDF